jgi:hypothetical protein
MGSLSSREKLFLAFALAVVFIAAANPFKDSDSFYHLKAGQLIWETKSIPRTDVFSSSAAGSPWVTHEWLAELLFYSAFRAGSYKGVILVVALSAVFTYFLVIETARRRGSGVILAALLAIIIGYLPFDLWVPRPQVFSFLAFALLLFSLENYRQKRTKKWLYMSIGTVWVWANLNASVLLGLVVILFYAAAEFSKLYFPKILGKPSLSTKEVANLALATSTAFASSLANPNTYHILFYRGDVEEGIRLLRILEFYPITYFYAQSDTKLFLLEIMAPLAFLAWFLGFRKSRRDLTSLGLVVGLAALPFTAFRLVGYWPLAVIPFLAPALSEVRALKVASWRPRWVMGAAFVTMGALFVLRISRLPADYFNPATVPVRAVDFIQESGLKGPFFNLYNEGGYLLWRLWPQERVFVDARAEVYRGRPFKELFTIVGDAPGAANLINDTYHFNYMVLGYHPDSLFQWVFPLLKKLASDRWPLVYWDDVVVIYVRPAPENKNIIEKYALWHVNPFRSPQSIPAVESKAAKQEIESLLRRVPDSQVVRYYARQLAARNSEPR